MADENVNKREHIKGTSKQRLKAKLYQIADNKELLDTDDLIEELSRQSEAVG